MGKRTGKKDHILLKLDGDLKNKFEAIRSYYAINGNTDLVRFLINEKYREICKYQNNIKEV